MPCHRPRPFVLALVGAESSGKTQLAAALRERLAAGGEAVVVVVDEYLREFCDAHGRTPHRHEQAAIAAEQTRRIDAARRALRAAGTACDAEADADADAGTRAAMDDPGATGRRRRRGPAPAGAGVVIADTTALLTAVYSDAVFGDCSLYADAERDHAAQCDFTLLAAPDLPWQADGVQRTDEYGREAIDARVRAALRRAGAAFAVVGGAGPARPQAAWQALRQARATAPDAPSSATRRTAAPKVGAGVGADVEVDGATHGDAGASAADGARTPWRARCDRCGDAACERAGLLPARPAPPGANC